MMSLDNTYSEQELREFVDRVQRLLPGQTLEWMVEPKSDGVAVSLRYENGPLQLGATRGDGNTGEEFTSNLTTIRTSPLVLKNVAGQKMPNLIEVRGEIYMTTVGFKKLNEE